MFLCRPVLRCLQGCCPGQLFVCFSQSPLAMQKRQQVLCRNSLNARLELLPCASVTIPAGGCSKLFLPGDQAEGQCCHQAWCSPDQGERKRGSLCLPQPPEPPNLLFQRDLIKAEVLLWIQKQKGNRGPRVTTCCFSLV